MENKSVDWDRVGRASLKRQSTTRLGKCLDINGTRKQQVYGSGKKWKENESKAEKSPEEEETGLRKSREPKTPPTPGSSDKFQSWDLRRELHGTHPMV